MTPPSHHGYRKLPGTTKTSFGIVAAGRFSLWLGKDHLLSVSKQYYTERYRRFYYQDIQSIVYQKTQAALITTWFLVALAALFLGFSSIALQQEWGWGVVGAFAGIAGFFLVLILINTVKGPSCRTFIQTAVQRERLYSLNRIRKAKRVIALIRKEVEAVQGVLAADDARQQWETAEHAGLLTADAPPVPTPHPIQATASPSTPRRHYGGAAHAVLCTALLADAMVTALRFVVRPTGLIFVDILLTLIIVIAIVVALPKQFRTLMPAGLKSIPWCTMGYLFAMTMLNSVFQMMYIIQHPDEGSNVWTIHQAIFTADPSTSLSRALLLGLAALCSGLLGAIGLMLLNRYRNTFKEAEQGPGDAP